AVAGSRSERDKDRGPPAPQSIAREPPPRRRGSLAARRDLAPATGAPTARDGIARYYAGPLVRRRRRPAARLEKRRDSWATRTAASPILRGSARYTRWDTRRRTARIRVRCSRK